MLVIFIIIILLILISLIKKRKFNNKIKTHIEKMKTNINKLDLNNIKRITKEVSINRQVGSTNLINVKKFIINELNNLGILDLSNLSNLSVEEQKFTRIIKEQEYSFSNIIATNKLINDNYIILGCHIDSPQLNSEAAIDAATSVGIIIEIVKNLLIKNKNYPIMIVFFDGEEAINGYWSNDNTLSGSNYFVNNFNKNIKFLMILDLIGGDIDINKISYFMTKDSNNSININHFLKLAKINEKYPKQIFINPNVNISDTSISNDFTPFYKKNINLKGLNLIPAIFPKNHHTIDDNYNNVNWEYVDIFSNVVYEFLLKFD
jgi:hypothetical protein